MKLVTLLFFVSLNCFSQKEYSELFLLKKKSEKEYQNAISDSIKKLTSTNLGNFFYHIKLEDPNALKSQEGNLSEKMQESIWALDLHLLANELLKLKYSPKKISEMLDSKRDIWDNGEWSIKFWKLITTNHLHVIPDVDYLVDTNGNKKYNVETFIDKKILDGEIGENPMLIINYKIVDYQNGKLIEKLKELDIRDMNVSKTKSEAPKTFGKRGIDGVIEILIR